MAKPRLPYFEYIQAELARHNPSIEKSFGRHVHWGYWDDPARAVDDDEDFARAAENLAVELCKLASIGEGQAVLDVGCGFGGTIASLNERYSGLSLTGLNIDARQLARAREIVHPRGGNSIDFREGDACSMPFADQSFDRVLAVECIFHFRSREAFFREARRVLKPGGKLVLSDFVPSPLFLPFGAFLMMGWFETLNVYGHTDIRYTVARYRRLARENGFTTSVARNATRNTQPTYRHIQRIGGFKVGGWTEGISVPLIRAQQIMAAMRLLNYYLLRFDRT